MEDLNKCDGIATWVDRVACIHFKRGLVLHKLTMGIAKMDGMLLNFAETVYAMMRCRFILLSSLDGNDTQVSLQQVISSATIPELVKVHIYLHLMKMAKGPIVRLEPLSIDEGTASRILSKPLDAAKISSLPTNSPVPPCQLSEYFEALMSRCKIKIPRLLKLDAMEPIYKVKNCLVWATVPDEACLALLTRAPPPQQQQQKWLVAVSSLETVYVLELQTLLVPAPAN